MSPNLLIDSTKSLVLMVDEKKLTFLSFLETNLFVMCIMKKIFASKCSTFQWCFNVFFCFLSIVNIIKQVCQQHDTINEFLDIFNPMFYDVNLILMTGNLDQYVNCLTG